jgi:hypothetical protein
MYPILTHSFTVHSTLPQFTVGILVIAFLKMTGTSLPSIHLCLLTPYPNLMFQHTLFTSIAVHT